MNNRELDSEPLNTLVVEDETLFRAFLEKSIDRDPRFNLVGSTASLNESRELLTKVTHVDVAWLDLRLPDGLGLELASELREISPEIRLVILTSSTSSPAVREALLLNVDAYLTKVEPFEIFEVAMEALANGKPFYSPRALKILASGEEERSRLKDLTPREREVLRLSAEGETVKEIGDALGMAESTVKTHRKALMLKTGARNLADLTRFALETGLLIQA